MDVLANHSIFQELQLVHDTGYFSAMPSLEENWQQVRVNFQLSASAVPASAASSQICARDAQLSKKKKKHAPVYLAGFSL